MSGLPPPRIELLVWSPSSEALVQPLSTLLEPSQPLRSLLAPQLHEKLQQQDTEKPSSYNELLTLAKSIVQTWDINDQAVLMSAHPRIGETKNLSVLSGNEQGSNNETPGEVLKRLSMLNSVYEECYPGLIYTTFVNGRSRAEIIPEMEGILGLTLPAPSPNNGELRLKDMMEKAGNNIRIVGSKAWRAELQRGLDAMFDIARNRLEKLGIN
ncbi:putative OHCU decarboxylase protein [Meredithblackwellia eburnea MCA 4105]